MSDGFNCCVQNHIDVCRFKFYYDDGGGQEVESALLHSWLSHWCAQASGFCWHWEEFNLQKIYFKSSHYLRPILDQDFTDFGEERTDFDNSHINDCRHTPNLSHICLHTCKHILCCLGGPLYQPPWEVWLVVVLTAQSGSTLTISPAICWALSSLFRG